MLLDTSGLPTRMGNLETWEQQLLDEGPARELWCWVWSFADTLGGNSPVWREPGHLHGTGVAILGPRIGSDVSADFNNHAWAIATQSWTNSFGS